MIRVGFCDHGTAGLTPALCRRSSRADQMVLMGDLADFGHRSPDGNLLRRVRVATNAGPLALAQIDALMSCQGLRRFGDFIFGFQRIGVHKVAAWCGQDREGPLRGRAGSYEVTLSAGLKGAGDGRRIVRRPAGGGSRI